MHYFNFKRFIELNHSNYINQCIVVVTESDDEIDIVNDIIRSYNYNYDKITVV